MVAHHHQRDPARDVRRRHPQDIGLLRLAQAVHLVFPVRVVQSVEARGDVLVELVGRARRVEGAWIEQLVEQHRVSSEKLGDPGTGGTKLHELRQCHRTLRQQREIDTALRNRFHHRHHPVQGRRRVLLRGDGAYQVGQKAGQSLVGERVRHPEPDGVAAAREDRPRLARIGEPRLLQSGHASCLVGGVGEQGAQRIVPAAGVGAALLAEHLRELLVHVAAVALQPPEERLPVRVAHGGGDARPPRIVHRQHVLLPIGDLLQPVLGRAQEPVCGTERSHRMGRKQPEFPETLQHREKAPVAQRRCAPPPHHLKRLRGEFHFPDPPGPVLHAVLHTLAGHLLLHHRLERAQRLQGPEVDVTPVHERTQPLQQLRRQHQVAAHRAGPDEGVALPVAAVGLVVLFERIEAQHQRPLSAERTQPHVDTVDEAVRGRLAEHPQELAGELEEEAVVVDASPAPLGLSVFGEGEDEVDVGGEVQLARAELAERQDDELLGLTGGSHRDSQVGALPFVEPARTRRDDRVGEVGGVTDGFFEVREAADVAPCDPHHLPASQMTQVHHQGLDGLGGLHRRVGPLVQRSAVGVAGQRRGVRRPEIAT